MELTKSEKIRQVLGFERITVPRVAILGMLLALLVAFKYVLGFVPGIEIISFMFIFLGIFLPILDLSLLIISFNVMILVLYGFGTWWIAYWVIWPVDAFVSKFISKFTRSKYVFALWGFIAGLSVFVYYFFSDWIFFDYSYATMNVISAIPINLIEGFTTMLALITIAPLMSKVFNHYSVKIWDRESGWDFKKSKYPKASMITTILLAIGCIVGIVMLFIYNDAFLQLKQSLSNIGGDKGHI